MAETIRISQSIPSGAGPSQLPPTHTIRESQINEVNQPDPSDDLMIFDEEEGSSGSQHSTSKPKENKRKRS